MHAELDSYGSDDWEFNEKEYKHDKGYEPKHECNDYGQNNQYGCEVRLQSLPSEDDVDLFLEETG
jgi:hypothetical protein